MASFSEPPLNEPGLDQFPRVVSQMLRALLREKQIEGWRYKEEKNTRANLFPLYQTSDDLWFLLLPKTDEWLVWTGREIDTHPVGSERTEHLSDTDAYHTIWVIIAVSDPGRPPVGEVRRLILLDTPSPDGSTH